MCIRDREYASLKNELLSEEQENQKENRLPRLLQPDRWSSAIVKDGKPNLASDVYKRQDGTFRR